MKVRLYKTGDPCPCCGQPIKWTDKEELLNFGLSELTVGLGLKIEEKDF